MFDGKGSMSQEVVVKSERASSLAKKKDLISNTVASFRVG